MLFVSDATGLPSIGMMNGVQPVQMVMSQGQMQPGQMMGMMNAQMGQMQQPGQMANQPQGVNNPVSKPQSQPAKNICIEYDFGRSSITQSIFRAIFEQFMASSKYNVQNINKIGPRGCQK